MDIFNLYSVQPDDSKVLLGSYLDLEAAEAAQLDEALIYSVEKWDGYIASVLY